MYAVRLTQQLPFGTHGLISNSIHFPFQPRGGLAAGGRWAVLAPSSSDKLPQVQSLHLEDQSPTTPPNNEPNAEWLHKVRRGKDRKKTVRKRKKICSGQPAALQGLTLLLQLQDETQSGVETSCPSPRTQSAARMAGELMATSTRNTM